MIYVYVLINNGDGTHYASAAFAYYRDKSKDEYGQTVPEEWRYYFLVLNQEKTAVVKKYLYDHSKRNNYYKMVLILDDAVDDWNFIEDDTGEINTHDKVELLAMERNGVGFVTPDLLEEDQKYNFNEIQEICTHSDAERLNNLSWYFHDAHIAEKELVGDELRVLMDGIWGCNVEFWFSGDIECHMGWLGDPRYVPYINEASVWLENGYVYFSDDYDGSVSKLKEDSCWFRGKNVRYTLHLD